jgi:dihydroorotate dehydrogenase electron transfer subunit
MTHEGVRPSGLHRPYHVAGIRRENYRTRTLLFRESLPAGPGQFVMAWLPGLDEKPFSVAAAHPLALTVAAVGPFSRALTELSPGDRLWVRGPLGRGFEIVTGDLLLVGGGYGAAPLLYLARKALRDGTERAVRACIGARTAGELLLTEAFERAGADVRVTTEDGSRGTRGLVTAAVEAAIAEARPAAVTACGPEGMLTAVDRLCAAHGLPRQLSWEAHMRCGIGLCGSCELPPGKSRGAGWLVCLDGPVEFVDGSP